MSLTGTVTLANTRLSLVNGCAFFDTSAFNPDYKNNINSQFEVMDSAGKKAIGYIKSAGTGETLGSAQNVSNCVNYGAAPFGYNTFDGASPTGFHAVDTDNATQIGGTAGELALVSGHLFKVTFSATLTSGQAPYFSLRDFLGGNLYSKQITVTAGANTFYSTITGTTTGVGQWYNTANAEYTIADLAVKQVTAPSATGVTITSTPGGSTYNWASIESGFNYNDASGYTWKIIPHTRFSRGRRRYIDVYGIERTVFYK